MLRMGCGDVDGVDGGIGEERVIGAMRLGNPVGFGEVARLGFRAAGDGGEFAGLRAKNAAREFMGDGAGADNSPSKF